MANQYTEDLPTTVVDLVAMGANNTQIAEFLEVSQATLRNWRKRYPDFDEAFARDDDLPSGKGRPGAKSKYKSGFAKQAFRLCQLGLTDEELGEFFQVNKDTVFEWKSEHPKFGEAVKQGRAPANAKVANSLYRAANGARINATEYKVVGKKLVRVTFVKEFPPDTRAAMYLLNNRCPEHWSSSQNVTIKNAENLVPWDVIEAGIDEDEE